MRFIHVLIAEDEKLIRAGIRRMVEDFFQTMPQQPYVISEAGNGRDAYQCCANNCVDILITDVKMPGISGVTLVKRLAAEKIPLHVLAISGHEDYSFVREMLKMGAYDYLIKPINQRQLNEALDHFAKHLLPLRALDSSRALEQRLIHHLLLGAADEQGEWPAYVAALAAPVPLRCDLVSVRDDAQPRDPLPMLHENITAFAQGTPHTHVVQGEAHAWSVLCLTPSPDFAPNLVRHLEADGYPAAQLLALEDIANAPALCRMLVETFYNIVCSPPPAPVDPAAELDQLSAILLGGGDEGDLRQHLFRLFAQYQHARTAPAAIRKDFHELLYNTMSLSPDFIEFVSKAKFTAYDLDTHFDGVLSLGALQQRVLETLLHLYERMAERRRSQADKVCTQAVDYIAAHYPQALQLAQVAEQVHLHPNYFSTLFRRNMGKTFREHLREVRVSAAQKLLLESTEPLSRVAEQVGYSDTAHFLRAFKEVTGTTPNAYRRQAGNRARGEAERG